MKKFRISTAVSPALPSLDKRFMRQARTFAAVSLLLVSLVSYGCLHRRPVSEDNMIYRLVEDVSPYYIFDSAPYFNPANNSAADFEFRKENIALWRKQTGTTLTDSEIETIVYKYSLAELRSHETLCTEKLGKDAYDFLISAKTCEMMRAELNSPWYYPSKDDPLPGRLTELCATAVRQKGKFLNRYALQAVRAMVALRQDSLAVAFWENVRKKMPRDIIRSMTERHVAIAYRRTGRIGVAKEIYARQGDIVSLYLCSGKRAEMWEAAFRGCPNSPFFKDALQSVLTHFDNNHIGRCLSFGKESVLTHFDNTCNAGRYIADEDRELLSMIMHTARCAIRDSRVRDKAMWYYVLAALYDAKGKLEKALPYVVRGASYCRKGSFMSNTMRVMRMYLEARTSPYDSIYRERLAEDLTWLTALAQENISDSLRQSLKIEPVTEIYGNTPHTYTPVVKYTNKMYWSDALNRILAGTLAPRLFRQGKKVDALLLSNLGEFFLPRNATGTAHSPNEPSIYHFTDHSNGMADIAEECTAADMIRMYSRLRHPQNAVDRLVKRNGMIDKDFWHDMIGTRLIAEHRYARAAKWLKGVSHRFWEKSPVYETFSRDPFCLMIGWSGDYRHHTEIRPDYKFRFALRMAELKREMRYTPSMDKRAEAMVLYGVGRRNQTDWCWALSRHYDISTIHDAFTDATRSRYIIDRGLRMMRNKELKAWYLNSFGRNKEVMDLCPDTKIAKKLQARCDIWRDYRKNK